MLGLEVWDVPVALSLQYGTDVTIKRWNPQNQRSQPRGIKILRGDQDLDPPCCSSCGDKRAAPALQDGASTHLRSPDSFNLV